MCVRRAFQYSFRATSLTYYKASGQVGRPITEALLKTGRHTITALTRGAIDLPAGVNAVPVDYNDEATVVSALRGQQVLIISLAATSPPGTHDLIVTAALKAGVPLIMPNIWGADLNNPTRLKEMLIGPSYLARIKKIEELGLKWTSLCSSFWYEYSLSFSDAYGFDLLGKKATLFDNGGVKINTSTWDQCGRAVAAWLSLKAIPEDENDKSVTVASWTNKPIYISSFLVSQRDMLDSIHRVQGTTDADWEISQEDVKERYQRSLELVQSGDMVAFRAAMYSRAFFPNGAANYETSRGLDNDVLGLPKESLDEATARAFKMAEARVRS